MDILSRLGSEIISCVLSCFMNPGKDFGQRMLELQQSINCIVCGMLAHLFTLMDDILAGKSDVRKDWVCERISPRTLQTVYGTVTFKRRYYVNRQTGQHAHLLDDHLRITKGQRVSNDTRQQAIEPAVELSYAKSGEQACPGGISKMSVSRYIGDMKVTGTLKSDGILRRVELLYVEADEDHVSLQNGKTEQVRLVYIHEGAEKAGGRNRLKHARYLVCPRGCTTEELWEQVLEYIKAQYDLDVLKHVFLSGDGAGWIRSGAEYLPGCRVILDGFHVQKALMGMTARASGSRTLLWQALDKGDQETFGRISREVLNSSQSKSELERKMRLAEYLMGHWPEIQNRKEPGATGCSAEGHVSHILSARLSSRPLGWGEKNLYTIAQLRAMKANGDNISYLDLRGKTANPSAEVTPGKVTDKVVSRSLSQSESIFSAAIPILDTGKDSPLYQTLYSLAFNSLASLAS